MPKVYITFARKINRMPEFYMILAKKINFLEFLEVTCPMSPVPWLLWLCYMVCIYVFITDIVTLAWQYQSSLEKVRLALTDLSHIITTGRAADASFRLSFGHFVCKGVDAYMFYRCFFGFSVCHKIWDNRSRERIFMKLLPNDSGENGVSIVVPKYGLGPK